MDFPGVHDPRHRILAWDDEHGGKPWGMVPEPMELWTVAAQALDATSFHAELSGSSAISWAPTGAHRCG